MIKLFVNAYFRRPKVKTSEFDEEYVARLFETDVRIDSDFNHNDVISLLMLDSAKRLLDSMRSHGVEGKVGLAYNYGSGYIGWLLIVDTDNRSINPLVAKYFYWDRIESHDILTFEEITNK